MVDKVIVFDDIRKLTTVHDVPVIHCTNEAQFMAALVESKGETIQVVLDHDLGETQAVTLEVTENSREGISQMLKMHYGGTITVDHAFVVTMNPAGRRWIIDELTNYGISYYNDPGGKIIGMTV